MANCKLKYYLALALGLWFTVVDATLQQISYQISDYNKTFRRDGSSSHNNVELVIEASTGMLELGDGGIAGMKASTYLYCLGATNVEVKGIRSHLKVAQADSLIEVRDLLQKQMPNQIWSILSSFRASKTSSSAQHEEVTLKIKFSPYRDQYLAASSKHPITVSIQRSRLALKNVAFLAVGVILFCKAPQIAQQAALWYLGGVSLSVSIGALIMLYFVLNRLIPKRDSILVVGFVSSIGMWIEWFFNGFIRQTVFGLMKTHWTYMLIYFLIFGIAGFTYCYIKGPHTENPRITNVIQISLQLVASGLVIYAFNIPEIGVGVLSVLILTYLFYPYDSIKIYDLEQEPKNCNLITSGHGRRILTRNRETKNSDADKEKVVYKESNRRQSYVPTPTVVVPKPKKRRSLLPGFLQRSPVGSSTPKPFRRLMTEDEYLTQGYHSTKIELEKLRKYCRDKDDSPWQTMQRVDDPKRLASFVTGSPHISQIELDNFESELDSLITQGDDSDSESEHETLEADKNDSPSSKEDSKELDKENSNDSAGPSSGDAVREEISRVTSGGVRHVVAKSPAVVAQKMRKLR